MRKANLLMAVVIVLSLFATGLGYSAKAEDSKPPMPNYDWMGKMEVAKLGANVTLRNWPTLKTLKVKSAQPVQNVGTVNAGSLVQFWRVTVDNAPRLLVRSEKLNGWVDESAAKLQPAGDGVANWPPEPCPWPDKRAGAPGSEPRAWQQRYVFSPDGQVMNDVTRTDCDLFAHGRFDSQKEDHFLAAIQEDGAVSPQLVHDGWFERVEGDIWRYPKNWKVGYRAGEQIPGPNKAPIVGEFAVKDAKNFRDPAKGTPPIDPPMYLVQPDGSTFSFKRDEALTWPAAETILKGQLYCPPEALQLNVAGAANGDDFRTAAVGGSGCVSVMIGLNDKSADNEVVVSTWMDQKREIVYHPEFTGFYMMPKGTDPVNWIKANLANTLKTLQLEGRNTVVLSGVQGYDEDAKVSLADFLGVK